MKKEEKKDYNKPELVEHENLRKITKVDFSDPDAAG